MQAHTRNFLKKYKYGEQDWIPCAVCNKQAVDLHHVIRRSAGGTDDAENLIPVCRSCHKRAEFKEEPFIHKEECLKIKEKQHNNRLQYLQENYLLKNKL